MDKEKKIVEKQIADTVDKRRKLEDIHIELIELNRQKASILNSYSDAWQGNLADNTIRKLEDEMDAEWRETRKHVNALEDQLITEALANMMTEPLYGEITGKFIDRGTEKLSSPLSYSESNAEELWEKSVEYTGLTPNETLPNLLTI